MARGIRARLGWFMHGLAGGMLSAMISLFLVLSFALVAFGGRLAAHLEHAVIATLLSTLVVGAATLLLSAQRGLSAQPQTLTAVAFAGMAAEAMAVLPETADPATVLATGATLMTLATLLAGLSQLAAGAADGGALLRHLPYPVLGGYMAAAGAAILRSAVLLADPLAHPLPAALGLGGGVALFVLNRRLPAAFQPALLMAATALLFGWLRLSGNGMQAAEQAGWVRPLLLGFERYAAPGPAMWAAAEFPDALGLALRLVAWCGIVVMSGLLLAAGVEANTGSDVSMNREIAVQGVGSLGAAVLGGMPGSATPSVTALRWAVGATGRFPALVALLLIAAAGLAALRWGVPLPLPVAAAMLVAIAMGFLRDWVFQPKIAWTRGELAIVAGIALLALAVGFLEAVLLGTLAGALLFVAAYARVSPVRLATTLAGLRSGVERSEAADQALSRAGAEVPVLLLSGYLFFGAAHRLSRRIEAAPATDGGGFVVLDLTAVPGVDAAAVATLERLARRLAARGVQLVLGGATGATGARLGDRRAGLPARAWLEPSRERALERVEEALLARLGIAAAGEGAAAAFLVAACGPAGARDVLAASTGLRLADGQVLQRAGDPADGFYLLDAGRIVVRRHGARLRVILPGAPFGEIGRFVGGVRSADLVAEGEAVVLHLSEAALARLARESPEALQGLMHAVQSRLARRVIDRDGLAQAIFG